MALFSIASKASMLTCHVVNNVDEIQRVFGVCDEILALSPRFKTSVAR